MRGLDPFGDCPVWCLADIIGQMTEWDDHELLTAFARDGAETAFAEIVRRYVNLAFSAALRCTGNVHSAEEITQTVFIVLARKAPTLSPKVILSGWLYQTTRLTAANFLKAETRRQHREQEAYLQSTSKETEAAAWEQIAPMLDEAMGHLGETDRNAVVLRFFENQTAAQVAAKLNLSEAAAHKRVSRALEKLRRLFNKRGVTLTTSMIAGVVSTYSMQAAPLGLAAAATATALPGAVVGGSTFTLVQGTLNMMAWAKAKLALAAGVGVLLTAVPALVAVKQVTAQRGAQAILDRVEKTYASLTSYDCTGKTEEKIDSRTLTGSFALRLGRPQFYRVEYEFHGPGLTNQGAAWNDGSGDYFANDLAKNAPEPATAGASDAGSVLKMPINSPAQNLGMLDDLTGKATSLIPFLFLSMRNQGVPDGCQLDRAHVVRKADEKVGAADCYVMSSETEARMSTLWIGRRDSLIHKSQQVMKSKLAECTEEEVTELLRPFPGAKLSVKEIRQQINAARQKARSSLQPVTIHFKKSPGETGLDSMTISPGARVFTQTYENISVNRQFSPGDFAR